MLANSERIKIPDALLIVWEVRKTAYLVERRVPFTYVEVSNVGANISSKNENSFVIHYCFFS